MVNTQYKKKSGSMVSKTVLLLFVATIVAEVYTLKQCPHRDFKKKHTYTGPESIEAINEQASINAPIRSTIVQIQTIYTVTNNDLTPGAWHIEHTREGEMCKWKNSKPKYTCRKVSVCEHRGVSNGYHATTHRTKKGPTCPDPNYQYFCLTCHSLEGAKHFADQRPNFMGNILAVTRIDARDWVLNPTVNSCKLANDVKVNSYWCEQKWKCQKDYSAGLGIHSLENGHYSRQ